MNLLGDIALLVVFPVYDYLVIASRRQLQVGCFFCPFYDERALHLADNIIVGGFIIVFSCDIERVYLLGNFHNLEEAI